MASAINLFAASYSGSITTLSLSQNPNGNYALSKLSSVESSTPQPSWLEKNGDVIYLVNENFNGPNGSLIPLRAGDNGVLAAIQQPQITPPGPVASIVYNQGKAIALAHYGGSAVSTYAIGSDGGVSALQSFFFKSPPGPIPQQSVSHPHQTILDPTGKFIVVPDLGSDLIRVFSIDETCSLTEQKSFSVPLGSGPRHGAFLETGQDNQKKTFFFLISELANTVVSFAVTPADGSLSFTPVSTGNVLNQTPPAGLASAELSLSPDKRFVHTSARNASLFSIPDLPGTDDKSIPSDTLQTWRIDPDTGALSFQKLTPAGGRIPRHFSVNKNGSLAAVALQADSRIVIMERNVDTGDFGDIIASTKLEGEVNNVIWDE